MKKRGISNIIATVLMVLITVVLIGTVSIVILNNNQSFTKQISEEFHSLIQKINAKNETDNSFSIKSCNDGIDNDGDGYIDMIDIGCEKADDDSEDTQDGCRNDFSEIDGNIVFNPYFECDVLTITPSTILTTKNDSIPDYWGTLYNNTWYGSDTATHEKKWLTDETIPDISIKSVLWHPKPEAQIPPIAFTHDDRKNGIAQFNQTSFETGRWYEFECMFKVDNVMPIFTEEGDLNTTLYGSESEIGCEVRIYHPSASNGYSESNIRVSGPEGGIWNETYGLHQTWKPGSTNGWITQRRYVFIPKGTTQLFFNIKNYGIANLEVARMKFVPTKCNCDPRIPQFKKEGNLAFANFGGQDIFGIAFWGPPHRNGETLSYKELNEAGINLMIKLAGYHQGSSSWYWNMKLDNLSEYEIYGMTSVYGGFRSNSLPIFNKDFVPETYQDRATALSSYTSYKNFAGVYEDEPDCHTMGFLPNFEEWNWYKEKRVKELFSPNEKYVYLGYCGGGGVYTSDDDNQVEKVMALADIFSFTQNFPKYGEDSLSSVQLQDIGKIMRYKLERAETAQKKQVITWAMPGGWYGYAPQQWKNPDGTIKLDLMRFQIYNQIANKATGVTWFGTLDSNILISQQLDFYNKIVSVNSELNSLMPVLIEKEFFNHWHSSSYLEAMLKYHDGKVYLIATNPSYEFSGDITITLNPSISITKVVSLFENAEGDYDINSEREISFSENSFTDNFKPFGVHIYEIEQ